MNLEQSLTLLEKGRDYWNKYRLNHTEMNDIPNLSHTNLTGRDFSDFNFFFVDFRDSNLSNSNLQNANLVRAEFCRTQFTNVNLMGADFNYALFDGCSIINSDLRGAKNIIPNELICSKLFVNNTIDEQLREKLILLNPNFIT